ncbi:CD109 antigen-like [Megalops cyprinoides]|uniref:CD109 antigen-like n=1 Tax=Megalops cyprinoides TaxID=118141 RepID=UPI001863D501|nr:CD109 antigen-like [Megalops cyprinoides]
MARSTAIIMIPDDATSPQRRYTLMVTGYAGNSRLFTNKTSLSLSVPSFSVFIQTDKTSYWPGQMVKIRAVSVNPDGKPHKGPVDITVKDPKRNVIQQWLSLDGFMGVVTTEFSLVTNPPLGIWTIEAWANDVYSVRNFTVDYYVRPKFEVSVTTPAVVYYENNLTGKVHARYTYGRAVSGVLSVVVEYDYFGRHVKLNKTKELKISTYDESPLTVTDQMKNVTVTVTQSRYGLDQWRDEPPLPRGQNSSAPKDNATESGDTQLTMNLAVPADGLVPFQFQLVDRVAVLHIQVGTPFRLVAESNYPFTEFHYVVTSRGRVVAARTVTFTAFSLTPTESWAPVARIAVYGVRRDGEIVNDAIRVPIGQVLRNNVTLSWGQEKVQPEQEVVLGVTVTEPGALVGIRVADRANQCIGPSNDITDKEVSFPLDKRPIKEETPTRPQGVELEPRVCRDSLETWLWLETNMSEPKRSLHFTVPDSITTWFASAFVMSDSMGLGFTSTPAKLTVLRDFFLSMTLPPYIIRGEQLVLEVEVFNYLQQRLEVAVLVEENASFEFVFSDNGTSPRARAQKVSVGSQDGASVLFPIRPKVLGPISIKAHAVSALGSDMVVGTVLVKAEGIEKSYTKSLFLELPPVEQHLHKEILFDFPPDVVPGSQRAEVAIVGDILGPSITGLESLIQMPYGCGEQNMIHFAPSIYVLQYLTTTNQTKEDVRGRAVTFMMEGYQRELSYQRGDGSFSAFGDSDASGSTWLSAFVLRCFLQARPFISIDTGVLSKTAAWIVSQQGADGAFLEPGRVIHTELQGGLDGPISLTAYTLMALLEDQTYKDLYSGTVAKALAFLESKVIQGISSNYSLCLVAYALSLAQRPSSAEMALTELLSRADVQDGVVFWSSVDVVAASWQPRSADIEMAAYTLLSLYTQAKVVEGFTLMKWLSQQRNHLGGYGSTQDTIIALHALSRYASFSGSQAIDLRIKVTTSPSQTVANFTINSSNYLLRQSQEIHPRGNIHLNVSLEGRGFSLFQLNVFYNLESGNLSRRRRDTADREAFDLTVDVRDDEQDLNHISLFICTRLLENQRITQTGMVLMEVGMFSGFGLAEGGVSTDDLIRKVETPPGKVILYLDSVTTSQACMEIPTVRHFKVAGVQEALVAVYDYYEPRRRAERTYRSEVLQRASFCTFCGDDCRKCGERPRSGAASVTRSRHRDTPILACALVIIIATIL